MKAVVVSFDHLPLGFLGLYGNTWIDTPAFDRLAAEGVVFDRHFAAAVDADPTLAWCTAASGSVRIDVARLLERRGVATCVLAEEAAHADRARAHGFGEAAAVEGRDGLDVDPADTPFAQLVSAADAWLRSPHEGDWLLWLRSRGVPVPWLSPREYAARYVPLFEDLEDDEPPDEIDEEEFEWLVPAEEEEEHADEEGSIVADEDDAGEVGAFLRDEDADDEEEDVDEAAEFDQLLTILAAVGLRGDTSGLDVSDWLLVRAVYGGYVSLLDAGLGRLRQAIAETCGDDMLLIVTGAEGRALGERAGLPEDCAGLGEEVVHTPLLLAGPGLPPGTRRAELAQTSDLAATLLEWFGLDVAASSPGETWRSLLPAARGEAGSDREAVVLSRGDARGLRLPEWYLVRPPPENGAGPRLFAKPEDVWDLNDVAALEPGVTEELSARLASLLGGGKPEIGEST